MAGRPLRRSRLRRNPKERLYTLEEFVSEFWGRVSKQVGGDLDVVQEVWMHLADIGRGQKLFPSEWSSRVAEGIAEAKRQRWEERRRGRKEEPIASTEKQLQQEVRDAIESEEATSPEQMYGTPDRVTKFLTTLQRLHSGDQDIVLLYLYQSLKTMIEVDLRQASTQEDRGNRRVAERIGDSAEALSDQLRRVRKSLGRYLGEPNDLGFSLKQIRVAYPDLDRAELSSILHFFRLADSLPPSRRDR